MPKKTKSSYTFPAIIVTQGSKSQFIMSSIPAKTLFSCSRVTRADENPEKGYQRLLSEPRARRIANYFDSGKAIPGSIIVSAKGESNLEYDKGKGTITFSKHESSFLVIDGQHRLYGANFAEQDIELPVAILRDLNLEDEVEYFLDINGEQKGVPRALRLEVEKFLVEEDSVEKTRNKLVHKLNDSPTSPLQNRISPTKSQSGKLSQVPFKNALEPLLDKPPIRSMTFEFKYRLFENFFTAILQALEEKGEEKRLSNAAFFQAIMGTFPEIIHLTRERDGDYKTGSFYKTIEFLKDIDWSQYSGTNKKEIARLTDHIKSLLEPEAITDDHF